MPPVQPMLSKRIDALPDGVDWIFEPKWDGFRVLVFRDGDELLLQSRDTKPLDRYFPDLRAPLLAQLPARCALDGEIVTVVPATVGKVVPDGSEDEEWRWVVDATREVHGHARAKGVKIAIEPLNRFETYLFNRGAQALALADAVAPDCGVCLDTFHLNIEEEDMYDAIRQVGARLYDFHVADNNRFACGLGMLDWPKIVACSTPGWPCSRLNRPALSFD